MAATHPWQPNESCDLVIRHLVEGRCIALPTEANYEIVASALCPEAVASLAVEHTPAVVLSDYANLREWMPLLAGAGPRLLRKLGAGLIVLHAGAGFAQGLWARL